LKKACWVGVHSKHVILRANPVCMEVWWPPGELEQFQHIRALQQDAGQHCSWPLLLVLPLLTAALPQSCL
jgi:hypothetical protein